MKSKKAIWITWHISQRSRNLAKDFNLPIFEFVIEKSLFSRHIFSSLWTFYILAKWKPTKIFLQYSFLLLLIIAIYKLLVPYKVEIICDCHTKALRRKLGGPLGMIFWWLKKISFTLSDVCIISNVGMEPDIKKLNDRYYILPDKIPDIKAEKSFPVYKPYCVFVNSYAVDEPLEEVIEAAKILNDEIRIFCTGKIPKRLFFLKKQPYPNIYFTDYLKEKEYNKLITNPHCILALTCEEDCLQCAGYEALSVEVPLVVSNTSALRNYFEDSAVYVENEGNDIVNGIKYALQNREKLLSRMKRIKHIRKLEYTERLNYLDHVIEKNF